jgi:hypothetical protein
LVRYAYRMRDPGYFSRRAPDGMASRHQLGAATREFLTALKSLMIASFRFYAGLAILGAVLTFVALTA